MALKILSKGEFKKIDLFGNSLIIANALNLNTTALAPHLECMLHHICGLLRGLDLFHVFHVRHLHNSVVDDLENIVCHLGWFEVLHDGAKEFVMSS